MQIKRISKVLLSGALSLALCAGMVFTGEDAQAANKKTKLAAKKITVKVGKKKKIKLKNKKKSSKYTYKSNGYTFTNYYNSKEQNTKTVSSDATTKSTEKSTYKNGRLVKTVRNETDKASKKVTKVTYTYKHKTDANGNVTETICYRNKKPYYKDAYSDYIQVVKAEE